MVESSFRQVVMLKTDSLQNEPIERAASFLNLREI